jgi:hypothetical protein
LVVTAVMTSKMMMTAPSGAIQQPTSAENEVNTFCPDHSGGQRQLHTIILLAIAIVEIITTVIFLWRRQLTMAIDGSSNCTRPLGQPQGDTQG